MDKYKTQQNNVNKDLKKKLIWAIVATILFIVGIPITIIGATKSIWAILAFGIAFLVFGFYGAPILWISYGSFKTMKNVVDAVMEDHLTTNSEIAQQLQIREKMAKEYITNAIKKKYITGYIYDGTTLTPNKKEVPKKNIIANKCPNCGGKLEQYENGYKCPYCGSKFEKE